MSDHNDRETDATDSLAAGFTVGQWTAWPLSGVLESGGHRVHVEPRVMDVLVCLARRPGEVVTRNELLEQVWGSTIVTDDSLTRCISELRTVLGDTARERSYIRTVPKRGYSLIMPVSPMGEAPAAAQPAAVPGGPAQSHGRGLALLAVLAIVGALVWLLPRGEPGAPASVADDTRPPAEATAARPAAGQFGSVAVLPFVNLSGDAAHDYFSDGLAEDIRNTLLTATPLKVAARTSSRAFREAAVDIREIGRRLGVDTLLEGTVRIAGNRVRVTAQLSQASDGYPVWANSFEREIGEKIQAQVDMAGEIVGALVPSLAGQEGLVLAGGTNAKAHEYYLLGRHHWHLRTPESLAQAIDYFEQALRIDPGYALAHSGLSDSYMLSASYAGLDAPDAVRRARPHAERALELDPGLAEAHASLGMVLEHEGGKLAEARDAYQRAVDLKPNYSMAQMWLGNAWQSLGEIRTALTHYENALELDPMHPQVQFNYVHALMGTGRYREAGETIEGFLRFAQDDELVMHEKLTVMAATGRYDEVLSAAVSHNFSGRYKPYASRPVIESLIHLGRFDDAQRMLDDNAENIEDWLMVQLRATLALARRDPVGLREAAAMSIRASVDHLHPTVSACKQFWGSSWNGVADYIAGDHAAAVTTLENVVEQTGGSECRAEAPAPRITLLDYYAASLKAEGDARWRGVLEQAASELAEFRERGWDPVELAVAELAMHVIAEDEAAAGVVLAGIERRDWQAFGLMRTSALFDSYRGASGNDPRLAALAERFEQLENQCRTISLAKLGL